LPAYDTSRDLAIEALKASHADAGRRRNQVQVELALQALAGDLHVQQAQKAAPEAETQRHRRFRLVGQSRLALSPAASGTP
jgi:hypothetical protein